MYAEWLISIHTREILIVFHEALGLSGGKLTVYFSVSRVAATLFLGEIKQAFVNDDSASFETRILVSSLRMLLPTRLVSPSQNPMHSSHATSGDLLPYSDTFQDRKHSIQPQR